jgi:hypothetical protein
MALVTSREILRIAEDYGRLAEMAEGKGERA